MSQELRVTVTIEPREFDLLRALQIAIGQRNTAEKTVERLREWIIEVHGWAATCDWGDCEGETVGYRGSPETGVIQEWLPVCELHYEEASEHQRILLVELP